MEGLKARRQSNSGKKQSNDGTRQFAFLGAPPQWLDEPKGTNNNATVHIDHDNYDSDGESLDSISGRSFRAKTPVGTTTGETALEGMSLFLQRLINEKFNPLSELHEYYQRKKVGIQECFEEVSAVGNTKGYGIYWHCSFRCPISNVSVTSCIPAPIFISSWDADESLQNQTAELLCGEMNWDLEEEGWVYFSSKKAAKKSCAWAALQRIGSSSLPVDANVLRLAPSRNRALEMIKDCCTEVNSRPLLQSISGSPTLAQQYETDNLVNLNASLESATGSSSLNRDAKLYYSAPPNNPNASNKKFPVWVEVLYDLGVSTIDITYREYVDAGKNDFTGEWRMEATQICCQMAIRSPIVIKTIGNPCYSKEKARQSSLTLFQLEMERLARTKSLSRENAASARSREIAKEHLLSCDAKDIQIVHSLPAWAMPRQTECDNSNTKHPWFLYELDLQTQSGGCLLDHYTNWKNSKQTRVGILVPAEINPSLLTGESFSTLFHNSINPEDLTNGRNAGFRARATLVKKKLVDSPLQSFVSADGSLVEYEVALRHFNKTLINWKHYGCGNRAVANQGIADNTTGFHSRGYLFVPLLDMDPTDHEGLGIDYELIKRNWDSTYESLFIGTCCQYELPLVGSFGWKSIAMSSFLLFLLFHPSFYTDRTGSCVASAWETLFSSFFLVICVNSVLLAFLVPTHSIPFEALNNRFVRHRGICYYVAPKNKESITMWSRFPTNNLHTPTSREDASDKQGKEPQPNFSTFNDYYLQKYDWCYSLTRFSV